MTTERQFVARGFPASTAGGASLTEAYESLLIAYLASLLYLYPYGVPLGGSASIRAPDILGLLCLALGACVLMYKRRVRADLVFLAIAGPFVILELVSPTIGAFAYRKPVDAVSSLRMAILWLPMIMLAAFRAPAAEPAFRRRFRGLLVVSLWLNIPYAIVQIAADFGVAPSWLVFTRFLEPWAVDRHFDVVVGLRPAGFFVNTTALSVFGIVCLCFFYAMYVAGRSRKDLWYAMLSLFLVVLTTSRVAFAAAALILALGWFGLSGGRRMALLAILAAGAAAILVAIENTIGLEETFYRFTRLAESGLLADVSFGHRVRDTWPRAIAISGSYPLGTWISAPRVAQLIDSGYLNYYIQGRWAFIGAIGLMLACQWTLGLRRLREPRHRPGALMLLFVTAYLTLGLVITNPARSPLVIAFLVLAYWVLREERDGAGVLARPTGSPA